jgi:predicted DNA-binding transcriptional regulator AlpA
MFGFGSRGGLGSCDAETPELEAERTADREMRMRTTDDTLIGIADIRTIFKLGRTAAYDLVRRPDFPARVVISARCHRWWASEVDAFAARLQAPISPVRSAPARAAAAPYHASPSAPLARRTGHERPAAQRRG